MSSNVQSLPSSALGKIIFFILLQIGTCFFVGWGIIPTVVLLIGYFLSKKDENPNPLLKAIKASQFYVYFTFVLIPIIWGMVLFQSGWEEASKGLAATLVFLIVGAVYLVLINILLKQPILDYPVWVKRKELSKPTKDNASISISSISVVQVESVQNTSSVDDLFKLKELKDQGLISESEFIKMKDKIMGNNL